MLSGNVRFIEGALFWPNRRAFGMNSDVFDKKKNVIVSLNLIVLSFFVIK